MYFLFSEKGKDRLFLSPKIFTLEIQETAAAEKIVVGTEKSPPSYKGGVGVSCWILCSSSCSSFIFKQGTAERAGSPMKSAGQRGCAVGHRTKVVLVVHVQYVEGIYTLLKRCPLLLITQVLAVSTQINTHTISPRTANFIALLVF